ncbi:MAG: glycosyltransferase [Actinomycetota bacterium]
MKNNELTRHGLLLFIALTVANLSNYVFHVVISRMLGPAQYGALGALLSVFILISVPAGALQVVVAKRVAVLHARGDHGSIGQMLKSMMRGGVMFALYSGILVAAWAPALSHFLRLGSVVPGFLIAALVVPAVLTPMALGAVQGQMRFKALGAVSAMTTILRLAFGIAFVKMGWGVSGAVGASVASSAVGLLMALLPLRSDLREGTPGRVRLVGIVRDARLAMLALGGFWAVVSLDSVLARHFLSDHASGIYAAAAVLSRAVLFLPGAIAAVAFPRFAESDGKGVEARKMLFQATVAVFVLGITAAVFLSTFGPFAVRVLFGRSFAAGGLIVGVLGFAGAFLGVTSILIYYHLASNSRALWSLGVAIVFEVGGISLFHDSALEVAVVMMSVSGVLLVFNLIAAYASPSEIEVLPQGGRELWDADGHQLDLSVVTPSYNPGTSYRANLERLLAVLQASGITYEVIAVSDGSTDGSEVQALEMVSDGFRHIHYEKNRGKGFALRTGLAGARGKYVAFIDSDGDLDPSEITSFITLMNTYDADLVLGSKRHPLSQVEYPPLRRAMSMAYYLACRVLFRLKVRDTQTGLKLAKRDVLAQVLPRMLEKRFAFDLEMLVVAKRLGFTRFFEAPVKLHYRFSSTVSFRTTMGAALDTMAIFYRCYILRYYDNKLAYYEHEEIVLTSAQLPSIGADI